MMLSQLPSITYIVTFQDVSKITSEFKVAGKQTYRQKRENFTSLLNFHKKWGNEA